ncbi:alanyl-tRNA editing protein [Halomicrococcus gelatinilyticus]|uniref:alanyl-tRNA editing protein n=1 Tax=Halomicrococcus gelatinilyticus TaxID=1702103 RepID=UPI002E132C4D
MTEQRYLPDADDVTAFEATVEEATEAFVVLDGTYFYPEGGGQPADHGVLEWDGGRADVVEVRTNHGDVRHYVENREGDLPDPGDAVEGHVDEERRRDHRRMHTAQHVVSRVVLDDYGAETAGNQIHADRSRIDFEPADFSGEDVRAVERKANEAIESDLVVTKAERPRDEVEERVDEGRSLLDLIPDHVDPLRVVEIDGFDYCPCGGTHVDSLGDVGRVRITNRESKGEDTERIEFVLEPAE